MIIVRHQSSLNRTINFSVANRCKDSPCWEELPYETERDGGEAHRVSGEGESDEREGQPAPGLGQGGEEGEVERQAAHRDRHHQPRDHQQDSPPRPVHQAERH